MKALVILVGLFFSLLGASIGVIANHSWNMLDLKERLFLIFLSLVSMALAGVCFYPILFL